MLFFLYTLFMYFILRTAIGFLATILHGQVIQLDGGHRMEVPNHLHLANVLPLLLLIQPGNNLIPGMRTIRAPYNTVHYTSYSKAHCNLPVKYRMLETVTPFTPHTALVRGVAMVQAGESEVSTSVEEKGSS